MLRSVEEFNLSISNVLDFGETGVRKVLNERELRNEIIDRMTYNAVFNKNPDITARSRLAIRSAADKLGIFPASIQEFYTEMGKGAHSNVTVPAINIRGLSYDMAQTIFEVIEEEDAGPVIFEIARSEIGYTDQWPSEYATVVLAAAIKTGYRGPVFIQGDHFQVNARIFNDSPDLEIDAIKLLIRDSIHSGILNIDIDTSTLVDLSKKALDDQQHLNYELSAMFTNYIRQLEPANITVSVGGEIGEVGGKNSTPEELIAYMDGYNLNLKKYDPYIKGLSKISVQTGTTHGGVPLPDGSVAKVKLDFDTLQTLSRMARNRYGLAGAVQHGASTLPDDLFHRFPETGTAEIHLATGFQNIILDHEAFPGKLRNEMYEFLGDRFSTERKEGQTYEQFIYKTRKKSFGPFKQQIWDLPSEARVAIRADLKQKFEQLFSKLNVSGSRNLLKDLITPPLLSYDLGREREMIR
jgi:fructose/tagatose bisphosphate aldolase